MKGFFFQQPLEYHLTTEEEEWEQGGKIRGELRVKNIEYVPVNCETIQIGLAYGTFKKIKAKEEGAWKKLQTQVLAENITIAPQENKRYEWCLELETDCPITDKIGSPFLFYGGENLLTQGRIDIILKLFPMLQSFLQTFETQYRFKKRYEKSKGLCTEVKLIPPESRELPNLDHVLCFLRIHQKMMEIRYIFKMKSLGRKENQNKVKVMNKKREYEQKFTESQYSQGGFPNRECFRKAIEEALEIAKPKVIF